MDIVCNLLVYAGAALMVYNIWRCYGFIQRMKSSEHTTGRSEFLLYVPLGLLVMFLIGYLVVGLFGDPDIVIAGILSGGSLFVFIVLGIMYDIIDRLNEGRIRSESLYDELRHNFDDLTKDYTSIFRVNLTKDVVEERRGTNLYPSDLNAKSYTELMQERSKWMIARISDDGAGSMTRDGLLRIHETGGTSCEEMLMCTLNDGTRSLVRVHAVLATKPPTNDVVAFVTEQVCNDDMVNDALTNKALIGQFDMITYLLCGDYHVVIGDENRSRGSIFPSSQDGVYLDYLNGRVAPVVRGTQEERDEALEALSIERIEKELSVREPYEVNISCVINSEVFYKRFVFYVVNREAHFYLLLKSDTTDVRREEIERNERLTEALEEAHRASNAKTTFLSNMSHDIRTPMNAIVGYTDFALRSKDPDEVQRYLKKIDTSSAYLLALINDVLEMSRIESGKIELELTEVDFDEILDSVQSMFGAQMSEKGITFNVTERINDCRVLCDETRLNRVLLNLLSNAYKFTPAGGTVTLSIEQFDDADPGFGLYEIRVKDSGIGMSKEFAERVFDAFERERNTTASGIQGTGLGMAITKRIVDMMQGSIEVNTAPGAGTEFVVQLTLQLAGESENDDEAVPSAPVEIDFEGMRALLAEDNEINREIACMLLEELGFTTDEAEDGQVAVEMLLKAGPGYYDVVITDIQMPVLDGYGEARAIRKLDNPELSNIPIIAMSANAFQEDIRAAEEAGMNGYVPKPVDMGVLIDELTRVLSRR